MTPEEYLNTNSDAYQWLDGTIDLLIDNTGNFHRAMRETRCPLCDGSFDLSGKVFDGTIHGIKMTCPECGQAWFIHERF